MQIAPEVSVLRIFPARSSGSNWGEANVAPPYVGWTVKRMGRLPTDAPDANEPGSCRH
jgi:hypothetical protein